MRNERTELECLDGLSPCAPYGARVVQPLRRSSETPAGAKGQGEMGSHDVNASTRQDEHILVADNSPSSASQLIRRLQSDGYSCTTVQTAADALAQLQTEHYAAAVIEPVLPGQNWYHFLHAIREANPILRVVIATAFPSAALFAEASRLNMACITKVPATLDVIAFAACGAEVPPPAPRRDAAPTRECTLPLIEWELINAALRCHQGSMSKAASALSISRAALYNKLSRYPPRTENAAGVQVGSDVFESGACPSIGFELTLGDWTVRWQIEKF